MKKQPTEELLTEKPKEQLFTKKEILELLGHGVREVLHEQDLYQLLDKHLASMVMHALNTFNRIEPGQKAHHKEMKGCVQELKKTMHDFCNKVESLEGSMMFVLHNIKKNQFLYANYPDEWVKEYSDIKKGLKAENKFMDKKISKAKREK